MKTNAPKLRLVSLLISKASLISHRAKSLRVIQLPIVALAIILSCVMCKKDPVYLSENDVMDVLQNAEKVIPLASEKDEIIETSSEESGGYRYTYEKHDVVDNIESIVYLGLNDDVIWPGNLVKGDKAHDFIYEPIAIEKYKELKTFL